MRMDESAVLTILVFAVAGLITLNVIAHYADRFIRLPNIIWLLLLGVVYGAFSRFTQLPFPEINLNPEVVLFVFVPFLVFAAAQKICVFHFRSVLTSAAVAGSVGILISMGVIALVFHELFFIPWLPALLFGVIISATDPLAVSALLHGDTKVPDSTKLLIEGESILNDGFVVTVFSILTVILFSGESLSIANGLESLIFHVIGAIVIGVVLARLSRALLRAWHDEHHILQVNLTLALAFGSYLISEQLGFSGILAVFAAALAFGYKPEPTNYHTKVFEHLWEYFEYIANAILFFLLGASFLVSVTLTDIPILLLVASLLLLFVSRLIALGTLWPLLKKTTTFLTRQDFWLLNLSGARGAVSVALILLLPEDFEYKVLFLGLAFCMILFSLVVYPLITKRILR